MATSSNAAWREGEMEGGTEEDEEMLRLPLKRSRRQVVREEGRYGGREDTLEV